MGRTYSFECEKCGYLAQVAGAFAEGTALAVQTIVCYECRTLTDAVVACKVPVAEPDPPRPPDLDALMKRLPSLEVTRWVRFDAACPVDPKHDIEEWKDPGKCPRCGVFIERGAFPFRQWD